MLKYLVLFTVALVQFQVHSFQSEYDLEMDFNVPYRIDKNKLKKFYKVPYKKNKGIKRIMSFNIRYETSKDRGERNWKKRAPRIVDMILFFKPDFIGMQEVEDMQRLKLKSRLRKYRHVGKSRGGTIGGIIPKGEFNPIFYRSDKHKLLKSGTFWLNPTMTPVKKGWGARDYRICTYAFFLDKESKKKFAIFNTHLSAFSALARREGFKLIADFAEKKNFTPYFVIGDLNDYNGELLRMAEGLGLEDVSVRAREQFGPGNTYTGFGPRPTKKLDFILHSLSTSGQVEIDRFVTIEHHQMKEKPLSDHLPVYADVRL